MFIGIGVVFLILIVIALRRSGAAKPRRDAAAYKPLTPFMSKAELSFFGVLRQAVADRAYIAAKVRVADVIRPKVARGKDPSAWQKAFNAIQAKHFDFVLCSPDGEQCWAAIELDDKSHEKNHRRKRDALLDEAMQSAGIPLVRIPAKAGYSVGQLRERLAPFLKGSAPSVAAPTHAPADAAGRSAGDSDACPKCGASRMRYEGDSGTLAGKSFWKCSRYPSCRYVEPVTSEALPSA